MLVAVQPFGRVGGYTRRTPDCCAPCDRGEVVDRLLLDVVVVAEHAAEHHERQHDQDQHDQRRRPRRRPTAGSGRAAPRDDRSPVPSSQVVYVTRCRLSTSSCRRRPRWSCSPRRTCTRAAGSRRRRRGRRGGDARDGRPGHRRLGDELGTSAPSSSSSSPSWSSATSAAGPASSPRRPAAYAGWAATTPCPCSPASSCSRPLVTATLSPRRDRRAADPGGARGRRGRRRLLAPQRLRLPADGQLRLAAAARLEPDQPAGHARTSG